ncbi:YncE family protein [Halomonas sp. LR3S48]|uniref:YncE family protein n=1 Tax=Halomonas sp. LR3S48 TaxID=2982694 RepID=UPI0021E4D776|nr:YncE family protein [Halomonas sp. LR3S48]UYG05013.1 YncE family protein [Halomonas sp. LR3S48]
MTREVLLLNQKCAHTLSLYDAQSGEELKHIRLPDYPHEFVVDSQGRYAFVGHYGILGADCIGDQGGCSVFVIDLETFEHVNTLSTWPYYRIHGLGIDDQDRLYAMSEGHNTLLLFNDPLTTTTPDLAVSSGGYKTHLFALTRRGDWAYGVNLLSNTITKFKPHDATFTPIAMIPGRKPEGNCLSTDERTLFISNRDDDSIVAIDTESMSVRHSATTGRDPNRIYGDPQQRLITTNYGENSLSLFDQQPQPLGRIDLDSIPIAMSFHPNGEHAFVSLKGDHIGVLNLESGRIVRRFATRAEPDVSCLLLRD